MNNQPKEPTGQQVDSLLKDFGVKHASDQGRENLRKGLYEEFEQYKAVERVKARLKERGMER